MPLTTAWAMARGMATMTPARTVGQKTDRERARACRGVIGRPA